MQQIRIVVACSQVMVKNPRLQRPQRIDVLHVGCTTGNAGDDTVDSVLFQRYQRQQVRGDVLAICANPVGWHLQFAADAVVGGVGQSSQSRLGKQHADIRGHAQAAHPGNQGHGQQRMPAQLEEVVLTTDCFYMQQLGPKCSQLCFCLALRRFVVAAQHGLCARLRQGGTVELAVGAQGQGSQRDIGRRHHVVRQPGQHVFAQGFDARGFLAFMATEPGHQTFVMQQDCRFTNGRMGGQSCLDLAQFDTKAMQLHLEVITPQELQSAVCTLTHQVATAVQAVTCNERAVDETLGLHVRQVQVATSDTGTADVQLAHHTLRHGLVTGIQYIQAGIADRAADRQCAVWHGVLRLQGPDAAIHRGFGRAIDVMQAHARHALTHLSGQRLGQFATTADDIGQRVALAAFFQFQELLQQGRYELHHADLPLDDQLRQIGRITMPVRTRQYQTQTGAQRPEQFPYRRIETDRRLVQQGAFRGWQNQLRTPLHQVAQATVLDHHTFRRAGGAGGVDHVRQMVGVQAWHHRVFSGLRCPGTGIQVHQLQSVIGKTLLSRGIRQQGQGPTVGQHVGQALGRVARIQWHVGTTGLEHGQQTDKQVRATFQADCNPAVSLYALTDQVMGQTVGGLVELAIAQTNAFAFQGHGIRCTCDLSLEQRLHRLIEYEILLTGVEIHQQTLTLLGFEQFGLCRNGLIAADHAPQQRLQVRHITLGSGCIEQCSCVIQGAGKTFVGFAHAQGQVELGKSRLIAQRLQAQIAQMQFQPLTAVPGQGGLEQRAMGQAAWWPQALDNLLEWQVLMFLSFQHASLDASQQFSDIRLARSIDTHGQGVHEQADQPFDLGTTTVGHRRTHDHFVLTGQTRQQHGPGTHEQHERRHAMALA